jgi:IS5 family transposase
LSLIEQDARLFWRWLQAKLRTEGLVELGDVLLDATTIEPVLFARVNESVLERFNGCNFGKKVVEKRWFFGKKVHLLSAPNGTMVSFRLTAGNIHDRRVFHRIVKARHREVTGDSGYRGVKRAKGQKLRLTKPFSQEKRQRHLNGKRVGAERVFNVLKKLGLEHGVLVKTTQSLSSHILSVLACLLAIQYLNLKKGLKPLAYGRFML